MMNDLFKVIDYGIGIGENLGVPPNPITRAMVEDGLAVMDRYTVRGHRTRGILFGRRKKDMKSVVEVITGTVFRPHVISVIDQSRSCEEICGILGSYDQTFDLVDFFRNRKYRDKKSFFGNETGTKQYLAKMIGTSEPIDAIWGAAGTYPWRYTTNEFLQKVFTSRDTFHALATYMALDTRGLL